MNNAKVAAALNTISLAFGELAEALTDNAVAPAPAPSRAIPQETFEAVAEKVAHWEAEPFDGKDYAAAEGALAQCPKHHVQYTDGTYGPYCKEITNDPAWGKQKGDRLWCRITPKNAAEWLRMTAAA